MSLICPENISKFLLGGFKREEVAMYYGKAPEKRVFVREVGPFTSTNSRKPSTDGKPR